MITLEVHTKGVIIFDSKMFYKSVLVVHIVIQYIKHNARGNDLLKLSLSHNECSKTELLCGVNVTVSRF